MSFGLLRGILPGVVAIALLALSCVSGLLGQAGRASISGVVTDSTRAVAPGVSVTATNTSTNFSVSALTNEVGVYRLPLLPLGPYTVTAKRAGFKIEERAGIVLTAEQAATVDLQISPGTVTEEVKVTANAEMISTATATVSQWIGERTVSDHARYDPSGGNGLSPLIWKALRIVNPAAMYLPRSAVIFWMGSASNFLR